MQFLNSTRDSRYFLGRRMQLAFVVKDMDAAIDLWTEKLKVGPFVVFERAMGNRHFYYRGERSPMQFSVAISYVGDTQIEFICQTNDAPSIYTEYFQKGGASGGAHHLAYWPEDMQAASRELTSKGFEEVASIRSPNGEVDVYYFSAPPELGGLFLEVAPMDEARRRYYAKIQELCERNVGSQKALRFTDKHHFLQSMAAGEISTS